MQVVEEDDRTRTELFDNGADRRGRVGAEPRVPPVDAPADVEQAELAPEQIVDVPCLGVRRTEEAWDGSDRGSGRALRPRKLPPRGKRAQPREVRVAPGEIPGLPDTPHCLRASVPVPE